MLRIDVDRAATPALYSSPPSNPFFGRIAGLDEIYAVGFRNPWRFSFDRLTGDLYVGDVGQGEREEIDIVVRGGNYGWRVFEGTRCSGLGPASCAALSLFIPPVTEYDHQTNACSVTGGYVYRGSRQSLPFGAYVFGDYCTGEILMYHGGVQTVLLDTALNISSFGEDEAGEVYVVGHGGSVHRIVNPGAAPSAHHSFQIPAHSAHVLPSLGTGGGLTTGYSRIQVSSNRPPAASAVLSFRRDGALVSETLVQASPALRFGRMFARTGPGETTAVAMVNAGPADVLVEFHFTDSAGRRVGEGAFDIPAGGKVAAFLNESPFLAPAPFEGSFTFRASGAGVSPMALVGKANGRGDFLMTAVPVINLESASQVPPTFPHFAHGGEWTTEFVLTNATAQAIAGTVHMVSASGRVVGTLPYALAAEASAAFRPSITEAAVRVGSARITPSLGSAPQGIALVRQPSAGIVISQSGAAASLPGLLFEAPVEISATVQSGLSIVNAWPSPVTAAVSLLRHDGTVVGRADLTLPSLGQQTVFLNELPGLIPGQPFTGIVRVTAPTPLVVGGLRRRTNERGEVLLSAGVVVNLMAPPQAGEVVLPHWAIGGGYDTQLILLNSGSQAVSGSVQFHGNSALPLPLLLP
jgi:hypothetical protein